MKTITKGNVEYARDCSVPRESAERILCVKPGTLTLDKLAERLSMRPEGYYSTDPLSVRDVSRRPIRHSKVYLCGVETGLAPYLAQYDRPVRKRKSTA